MAGLAGTLGPADRGMDIIRTLWSGDAVSHRGKYYPVDAKLCDTPPTPIPRLTAANGKKSMRLAGQYGDGLITDPLMWHKFKSNGRTARAPPAKTQTKCRCQVRKHVDDVNRFEPAGDPDGQALVVSPLTAASWSRTHSDTVRNGVTQLAQTPPDRRDAALTRR
jgi:hypothetical protein